MLVHDTSVFMLYPLCAVVGTEHSSILREAALFAACAVIYFHFNFLLRTPISRNLSLHNCMRTPRFAFSPSSFPFLSLSFFPQLPAGQHMFPLCTIGSYLSFLSLSPLSLVTVSSAAPIFHSVFSVEKHDLSLVTHYRHDTT